MSKKFELNYSGVAELMKSSVMIEVLRDKARGIQEAAGDGYEVSSYVGKSRANVSVKTKTKKAIRDNNKNNTLLKAMR
jgi:phage protein